MESRFLSAYLAVVSQGSNLSPCQLEVLNKINAASGPVSWRDLYTWAGEYRAAHPTLRQRIDRALRDFVDAFAKFSSSSGSSGRSDRSEREPREPRDRSGSGSPDPLGTPSGGQLRGIASGSRGFD
jgi:hypothetical protein